MFEALAIRFLWILHALRPKKTPGLCPPACGSMHTYRWPCRARRRSQRWGERELQRNLGKITEVKRDYDGVEVSVELNEAGKKFLGVYREDNDR